MSASSAATLIVPPTRRRSPDGTVAHPRPPGRRRGARRLRSLAGGPPARAGRGPPGADDGAPRGRHPGRFGRGGPPRHAGDRGAVRGADQAVTWGATPCRTRRIVPSDGRVSTGGHGDGGAGQLPRRATHAFREPGRGRLLARLYGQG